MIPKLIHYSWFSGEPFPAHIQALMETWKKFLPDYEFMLWDAKRLAEVNNTFANEAVSVRKWAFAADFIRVYAVYTYGGIWLDTDIEVFKSFDPYLNDRMFIGGEANFHEIPKKRYLTSHCFGAEKGHPFLKLCYEYYKDRHFIGSYNEDIPQDMRFDMTIIPEIQAKLAAKFYGYNANGFIDEHQYLAEGIHVYPSDFFDSPRYKDMKNVVCIHRAEGGWRPGNEGEKAQWTTTDPQPHNKLYYERKCLDKINMFLKKHGLYLSRISDKQWSK